MTMANQMLVREEWRPVTYVTVQDDAMRARIQQQLERLGWAVIVQPTGFHLVQALSNVIDGHRSWLRPGLIVLDAWPRGCAGTTIAAGLRDLGISIPIVLVAAPGESLPVSADTTLRIVDTASAERTVTEVAAGLLHRRSSAPPGHGPPSRRRCRRPRWPRSRATRRR
ncbi:MAG TPA: response regulator [Kofleriaceae bacterium]|nr:response regulator [Kofleriaceae bacterium]